MAKITGRSRVQASPLFLWQGVTFSARPANSSRELSSVRAPASPQMEKRLSRFPKELAVNVKALPVRCNHTNQAIA
ncbi:hypothetical protein [Variovorax sp. dw_308]|uniref:hypothetical protein n=1 Tax=Variovorax sp. dw_308 TaxID=2721546 RepID=UPI001C464C54|nr:hypothetical protein [Variovorax sp. dw_308]